MITNGKWVFLTVHLSTDRSLDDLPLQKDASILKIIQNIQQVIYFIDGIKGMQTDPDPFITGFDSWTKDRFNCYVKFL